ncbi:MAG: hypothetical protein VR67_02695 [Peptococcaceae bacterium BRH_c8a]|nr:MAG: hypothetical protein VR67_02695 [Peptococcaceae bacterium BRH_c8a]
MQCHRQYVDFETFQVLDNNRFGIQKVIEKYEILGWVKLSSFFTNGIEFIRLGWPATAGKPVKPQ